MDANALNELIAKARETVASVAQAEQRVVAWTAELAAQPVIRAAPARSIGSFPKRVSRVISSLLSIGGKCLHCKYFLAMSSALDTAGAGMIIGANIAVFSIRELPARQLFRVRLFLRADACAV